RIPTVAMLGRIYAIFTQPEAHDSRYFLQRTREGGSARGDCSMISLWQDVRYGLRVLARNPGFTAVAILTLALGIGANTALFSVVNGVLLNPLPFPDPDALIAVYSKSPSFPQGSISYPNFLDWQKENRSFSFLTALRADDYNITGAGEPERVHIHMISADFLPALGLQPLLGRGFR